MKTSILAGLGIAVGVGIGVAAAVVRLEYVSPWTNTPAYYSTKLGDTTDVTPESTPKAVLVGPDRFDFGVMESDAVDKHVFEIRNEGTGVLRVREGISTCKCTVGLIGAHTEDDKSDERYVDIPPGGSTPVTIQWKTKGFRGDFHQTAIFKTNDLENPEINLNIVGRVLDPYMAKPPELVFSSIPVGKSGEADVKVLGYRSVPFKILGVKLEQADTAEFFDVSHEPLSAEEVAKDKQAHNGQLIHVTVKPGLPCGLFIQKIVLTTGTEKDDPKVEIPVRGLISSDLSIIGRGWSEGAHMLSLGAVSTKTGAERTLRILARGAQRSDLKFELVSVTPNALKVSIGKTTEWEGGQVAQTPLTITIPEGSPISHFLGPEESNYGQIVISTGQKEMPRLRILVRFAVVE